MRVIGYTKVIPPGKSSKPNKPNHKLEIIRNFISGVRVSGDNGLVYDGFDIMQCDSSNARLDARKQSSSTSY